VAQNKALDFCNGADMSKSWGFLSQRWKWRFPSSWIRFSLFGQVVCDVSSNVFIYSQG